MTPFVTVWIPSFNHGDYLAPAIESVLGQTFGDLELVIVDDGSADDSLAIAGRYADSDQGRVTLLTHPEHANRGVSASANLAISRARGRLLLGLASDDVLYPDAIERLVEYLRQRPAVGCVYGYAHMIDAGGRRIAGRRTAGIDLTGNGGTLERLLQGNTIPSMTALFRRECLERAGPFDEEIVYSDWELFIRVAAHCELGFLPRALAKYRHHGANVSMRGSRRLNVERGIAVMTAVHAKGASVGGRLKEPRVQATIELQLAFLRFATGEGGSAEGHLRAAFERDAALTGDARWIADWLWSRLLQDLLPDGGPDFVAWFGRAVAPLVSDAAWRTLRREVAAARHLARALAAIRTGRAAPAYGGALAAVLRAPRHLADRRLGAHLLDAFPGGVPARAVRAAKRRLLPHR